MISIPEKQNNLLAIQIILSLTLLVLTFVGCVGELQTKISQDLARLSPGMTVAILPVQITGDDQGEAAKLFRQNLYANLEQTKFRVMERYLVDALLEQNNISDPERFKKINPIHLGEILGADAVLESTMIKMDRTYMVVHSSIELVVSVKMIDTRSGEVLWMAEQTETDYDGIAKIPTGITAAAFAPARFITNKVNLHLLTQRMTEKLTAPLKDPSSVSEEETFETPIIASTVESKAAQVNSHSEIPPILTNPQLTPSFETQTSTKKKRFANSPIEKFFTVQVGAYKNKTHAEKMISTLSEKGYKVYLCPARKTEPVLFKVHVEKFKTREEAIQFGHYLADKENLDQFVTRFPG